MSIKDSVKALRDELNQLNYNYYVLDNPTISDYEFDLKLKQLQDLETQYPEYYDDNSPTQRVGSNKSFKTVPHQYRMYSLDNSYSKEDLVEWENGFKKVLGDVQLEYSCELKYDGASKYYLRKWKAYTSSYRGDGYQGDDVTNNIPLAIQKFDRERIILPFAGFEK
jgi:DNA ligase (NAD+)